MGGQPGKPKPPGNPPDYPDDDDEDMQAPIEEPPLPIPVPPVERPPAPMMTASSLSRPVSRLDPVSHAVILLRFG